MTITWLLLMGLAQAQDQALSARDLFYIPKATVDQSAPPPQQKKTAPAAPAKTRPAAPVQIAVGSVQVTQPVSGPPPAPVKPHAPAALATMTTVQLDGAVKDCRDRSTPRPPADWKNVAESTVFDPGQRIRLVLQANTSGFVYMFARQSSGVFTDLYPKENEGWGQVEAYREVALPGLCVTADRGENPETEIWVLVTNNRQRAEEFRDTIRGSDKKQPVLMALNDAMNRASVGLASRDIVRDEAPEEHARQGEPEHAVYRKASNSSSDQVFSIKLRQR